jgi:hypothetical protein
MAKRGISCYEASKKLWLLLIQLDREGLMKVASGSRKSGVGSSLSPAASTDAKPRTWVLGAACQNGRLGPEPCQAGQSAQSRPGF